MKTPVPITVAHGDGIGPEIMDASLTILKEAGAAIEIEPIEIGEKVYLRGTTAGIEYQLSPNVMECIKLISRPGSEKIVRYAFEHARLHGRKKVTCFTKDNIMKMTDGLFHKVFDEIAAQYPDIANEHWIVDIGAAKMADTPEAFDVIVMPNLYGDILSDVAAQIAGSVGLGGSSHVGEHGAVSEALHG